MIPFWHVVGKRVCELNRDKFYLASDYRSDEDLADLMIMRAARKLEKEKGEKK